MKLGNNVKITVGASHRGRAREVFGALGANLLTPAPQLDVFSVGGSNIGYAYVPDGEALTLAQMRIAPWLELCVDDVAGTGARLEALGIERIAYHDTEHPYYAGPGGVVFRLARV